MAILVNNAGQAASAPFTKTDLALWQRMLAVNLTGTYLGIRRCCPACSNRAGAASSTSPARHR
jgi:3-hydroxybutyrate dehydrogenase